MIDEALHQTVNRVRCIFIVQSGTFSSFYCYESLALDSLRRLVIDEKRPAKTPKIKVAPLARLAVEAPHWAWACLASSVPCAWQECGSVQRKGGVKFLGTLLWWDGT